MLYTIEDYFIIVYTVVGIFSNFYLSLIFIKFYSNKKMCMASNLKMRKKLLRILGWVSFISIVFYVLFGRHFAMVLIGGDSMDPYIKDKELIIMEKTYEGWTPQRYDVVVVWDGVDKLAKRIIGLEGDTVQIKGGLIYLNGEELKDIYRHGKISIQYVDEDGSDLYYWGTDEKAVENVDEAKLTVPKRHVWVIGDNRAESWYGILPVKDVVGRVLF